MPDLLCPRRSAGTETFRSSVLGIRGLLLAALLLASTGPVAWAHGLVADTGAGPTASFPGLDLGPMTEVAGQFALSYRATVTAVHGWIGGHRGQGELQVTLHRDDEGLPGRAIYAATRVIQRNGSPQWRGLQDLSWRLEPGVYWVSFHIDALAFAGTMPGPVPSPMKRYAFRTPLESRFYAWRSLTAVPKANPAGIRVEAVPAPHSVPRAVSIM